MAEVIVAQRMWQRRDTAAAWTSKNPILAAGEIGVELSGSPSVANKFKIGDGVTAWASLPYAGGGSTGPINADDVIYDNSNSGMSSANAQDAIDELAYAAASRDQYDNVPMFAPSESITATTNRSMWVSPVKCRLRGVTTSVVVPSTSGDIVVDVNKASDNISVLSARPVVQVSEYTSVKGTEAVVDVARDSLSRGDVLLFDVDSAGTGASGLSVALQYALDPTSGPPARNFIALPLTYDQLDFDNTLAWTVTAGPLPTPQGAAFDGYSARVKANASLPAWLSSATGPLAIQASITPIGPVGSGGEGFAVGVMNESTTYRPKLALASVPDSQNALIAQMSAVCYSGGALQRKRLARQTWRYEMRYPQLTVGSFQARPQGILFLDADTVLVTAHYEEQVSQAHRVKLSTGEVTGWFAFPTPFLHIASIARSADGSIWFSDYATNRLLKVDLAASFAANSAVVTVNYNMAAMGGFGSMCFTTIGGTEYLIAAPYTTATTGNYIYYIPASVITNGGSFAVTDRYRRYLSEPRIQGMAIKGSVLCVSSNRTQTDTATTGWVSKYAIDITPADGATMVATAQEYGPGQYTEDIDFHPTTGHCWMPTEGATAVGSDVGWLAVWSSPLDGSYVENTYNLFYDGVSSVTIRINNHVFEVMSWTPATSPGAVSLGGQTLASAGWANNFFTGFVRNVLLQDVEIDTIEYAFNYNGGYEPNALTVYTLNLTNPGAEAGNTSGWTSEVGTLAVRQLNPLPHSGLYYFTDATSPSNLSRQRIAVPSGAQAAIDAGNAYAHMPWWQASFSTGDDNSACGLRALSAANATLGQFIAPSIVITPRMTWSYRNVAFALPATTRSLDALISMTRLAGTANDGYTDDIGPIKIYVK